MKFITTSLFVLMLNTIWTVCLAIPLMDLKNTLEQNVLQPVVTSPCSSSEGCWGWLPVQEVRGDVAIVPDDLAMSRFHTRRQIGNVDPSGVLAPWDESVPTLEKRIQPPLPGTRQNGNKVTKKDVFVSRSWGAGGMPFSVLYMSPHGPRGNHPSTTQQQEMGKATENTTPPLGHPNYRIALRNGASTQARRQYSIIPQLFISYGWGPFGK